MSEAPDSGTEAVGEGLGAGRQAKSQRCERPHDTPIGGETRERVSAMVTGQRESLGETSWHQGVLVRHITPRTRYGNARQASLFSPMKNPVFAGSLLALYPPVFCR